MVKIVWYECTRYCISTHCPVFFKIYLSKNQIVSIIIKCVICILTPFLFCRHKLFRCLKNN